MKTVAHILFLVLAVNIGFTQKISLKDAQNLAVKNRIEIANNKLEVNILQSENQKLKAQWKPNINASAELRWNTQLQTNVIPAGTFGNTEELKVRFGTRFNNLVGINGEQKIWDGTRKLDQKINDLKTNRQQLTAKQEEQIVKNFIAEVYTKVCYFTEQQVFDEARIIRAKEIVINAETRFEKGKLLPNTLEKYKLDVEYAQFKLNNTLQNLALAKTELNFYLNTPEGQTPSQTLAQLQAELADANEPNDNISISKELLTTEIEQLGQQRSIRSNLPSISAIGNYSVLQLQNNFNPLSVSNYLPFNYLGIKASIPIYNGGQHKILAQENSIRQAVSKNKQLILKKQQDFDILSTQTQLNLAAMDMTMSKVNMELAEKIFKTNTDSHQLGYLDYIELKNSEENLQKAKETQLTSLYNFIMAQISVKKIKETW